CRPITVGDGVRARRLRLGFVGELSYELHVPSSYSRYLWDLLMEAGADLGIRPFGLEAQYCLRAEKGHIIIGAESEARVTLTDIGMGWMWDRKDTASKKVGAPALRACEKQPGRMKLVGFRVDEGQGTPRDGALVVDGAEIVGYVCTTRRSEALGWQYGMALVSDGHAAKGGTLSLQEEQKPGERATFSATVTSPHFYDPRGTRLRA
ncbi:MAG: glycine cleavage T protein (aminomethyl transferase), partial [Gammaproteobacteria bacterium]|nr:glycine cleavage T protein (aminomethyl transferase) [Gammaproteobacteria bacterium]